MSAGVTVAQGSVHLTHGNARIAGGLAVGSTGNLTYMTTVQGRATLGRMQYQGQDTAVLAAEGAYTGADECGRFVVTILSTTSFVWTKQLVTTACDAAFKIYADSSTGTVPARLPPPPKIAV